jgi:non-lysosomal glucosylceramidase
MKRRATRREFLKSVAAVSLATGLPAPESAEGEAVAPGKNQELAQARAGEAKPAVKFPREHSGLQLSRISFPLGGIGTGGIGLGGRGNLQDWQIFNQPNRGFTPQYAFPCMWVKKPGSTPYSVVLERRLLPPYDLEQEGLGSANVPGLPRLAEAKFVGSFPLARVEFMDADCPINVALEAFSPFQPLDADASGLPCAVLSYDVQNPTATAVEVAVAWNVENPTGWTKTRRNQWRSGAGLTGLLMDDPALAADDPMHGTFSLAALTAGDGEVKVLKTWRGGGWHAGAQHFWFDEFSKTGHLGEESELSAPVGSVSIRRTIPAKQTRTFRFLMAWHFPNRTPERCGWESPKGDEKALLGNYYCTRFVDAWSAAEYTAKNLKELEASTRCFVSTLRDSTVPDVVKEAATANLSTLVSNTSFRIADGSFQGFEGCGDASGLGFGTCTHVWNYEVATQFLFPSLAKSMRETNFGYSTDAEGHMDFRHKLPLGKEHWGAAAADGQMGQIVKLYFDWKLSGDHAWMRAQWPAAKRALEYAWRPGGWDANKDGVMEGVQHNTYDVEFYGPNPLCEAWYLAALKAASSMARAVGEDAFATECTDLAEQGSRWTDTNLFNGDYYIQQIRGVPSELIATGLIEGMGSKDTLKPDLQVGSGCMADQLVGQYMATIAGLGQLLQDNHIHKTLESIYRYNYKRNLGDHASVERVYALNDEAALVICDYPRGNRPEVPFPYYSENFTGVEYAAAVLMMANGMTRQGVECYENVRRRYDGEKANPFDETEYGRHYARPMASWAAIPVLSGFQYDGRTQMLRIDPKWKVENFRSFWSIPTAWGSFQLNSKRLTLKPLSGTIQLRELSLPWAEAGTVRVSMNYRELAQTTSREGGMTIVDFQGPVDVSSSIMLKIEFSIKR